MSRKKPKRKGSVSRQDGMDHIFLDPRLRKIPGMSIEDQIRFDLHCNGIGKDDYEIIDLVASNPPTTVLGQSLLADLLDDGTPLQGFLFVVRMALTDGTKINNYYYSQDGEFFGTVIESVATPWKPGFRIKIHSEDLPVITRRHRSIIIPPCLLRDVEFFAAGGQGTHRSRC